MKLPFLLLFLFSIGSTSLFACSCVFESNFCEATGINSKVFSAEVIEVYEGNNYETFMDIKVDESILGNIPQEMLTIINFGTTCDISFLRFEIGETYIFRFTDVSESNPEANFPSFSLNTCSTSFLQKEGDLVRGNINIDVSSKNYTEFKNDIDRCVNTTILKRERETIEKLISISPNPTRLNFVSIDATVLRNELLNVYVFSADGKLIRNIENFKFNDGKIDVSDLSNGLYFLRISVGEYFITKRFVKL